MDTKVISTGIPYTTSLPVSYVRPESERPKLSEGQDCEDVPMAIIELSCEDRASIVQVINHGDKMLEVPNEAKNEEEERRLIKRYQKGVKHLCGTGITKLPTTGDRNALLMQACEEFLQVKNHGVSLELLDKMLEVPNEFFRLPVEEKLKLYSDDPTKTMRLSTSFNVKKGTVHNWRDYLRLHCYPDQYVPEWPSNPSTFKDIVSSYPKQVRELGFRLPELIAESLGIEKDRIKDVLGEQGQMAVNYYPPCPQPELTYGLLGHTDPNALTILLQDLQVSSPRVLKDGKWMAIKPHPNTFVINIGDQLQVLMLHRKRPRTEGVMEIPITFSDEDLDGVTVPHDNALVITLRIGESEVEKKLVDQGSSTDILYYHTFMKIGLSPSSLQECRIPLVGFSAEIVWPKGKVTLPVRAGSVVLEIDFLVVDLSSSYDVILGRPWIHKMKAIPSTYHQMIKYPGVDGIECIRGNPLGGNQKVANLQLLRIEEELGSAEQSTQERNSVHPWSHTKFPDSQSLKKYLNKLHNLVPPSSLYSLLSLG